MRKSNVKIKGKLRTYLYLPLLLTMLLIIINVFVYMEDTSSGVLFSGFVLLYFVIMLIAYLRNKPLLIDELINFATQYGLVQKQLLNEFEIPFFPKGHQPMNKGRKQTEYMSEEQLAKTKATRFKKGHIPKNHKPVGYERITRDGYIEVKTAEPNVFELKHRLVWIEHNGEIPPGYNIQFKDGNRQNVSIENLYMISRSEQLKKENSLYARYPEDVQYLIKLKGALNRQINKATKKNES